MANEDNKPATKGDLLKVVEGFQQELGKLTESLKDRHFIYDDTFSAVLQRLEAVEVGKVATRRGENKIRPAMVVLFRPHDGEGPKEGYPAIICQGRVLRDGFAPVYALYVLIPRKAYWEENVKEGSGLGEFRVVA